MTETAAEELLRLATPDAVDALLAALRSDDREVVDHVRDVLETTSSAVADEILWCHDARDGR